MNSLINYYVPYTRDTFPVDRLPWVIEKHGRRKDSDLITGVFDNGVILKNECRPFSYLLMGFTWVDGTPCGAKKVVPLKKKTDFIPKAFKKEYSPWNETTLPTNVKNGTMILKHKEDIMDEHGFQCYYYDSDGVFLFRRAKPRDTYKMSYADLLKYCTMSALGVVSTSSQPCGILKLSKNDGSEYDVDDNTDDIDL